MKNPLIIAAFLFLTGCVETVLTPKNTECAIPAILKDLSGLDGCGYVFELEDGTQLIPQITGWCGTPPISQEQINDPLYNFQFVNGKRVFIEYEVIPDMFTTCMVGDVVKITCIREPEVTTQE